MKIGRADVSEKVALIAEIGNNHEGSLTVAREMIEAAWAAGADAVKMQTLVPELFVSPSEAERLTQMRRLALSIDDTLDLIEEFGNRGIHVFSTPLDLYSAEQLLAVLPLVKVSSGDLTFSQLLKMVGKAHVDVILSTGMATLEEVQSAVTLVKREWEGTAAKPSLALLHCVSAYPASASVVNLSAIHTLAAEVPHAVIGYSDHVIGIDVAARSVAAGARIVEKHFTLDKGFSDFRDHALSADPEDFRTLRALVDEISEQMGSGAKEPACEELPGREAYRRSLTVCRKLSPGHRIAYQDLLCQRPGGGFSPADLDSVIGRTLSRGVEPGHVLTSDDLSPA